MKEYTMKPIARIYTDFPDKFGIPRQSGIVKELKGRVVFEPPYRDYRAVKELSEYSHIWLLWLFSRSERDEWSPTVRPPRLGGNTRVGVFATRSPYRPNPIGMSAVKLDRVVLDEKLGPVLEVSGIDIVDGTPILDIKPYLTFADSYSNAVCGFADRLYGQRLAVIIPESILKTIPDDLTDALKGILAEDPRPRYQNDPERVYGFAFGKYEVKFKVDGEILTVISVEAR
ncbi:MAG: tRNA (N6-threonylcarbamoyladenosine(37)-N6)-methyltransferase TrmO [Acutalibacteraceae bacterium]|nr:tRNA (N6-threonylcarbamoyladenosine(37)-N6)-methyltransferase TrmO [Acutalibacteraceae bacterium]